MKRFIFILVILKCIAGQPRVDPLVSTPKGQIKGLRAEDGDYDMFLGIPYAVVDENNPFGPASPHPGFESTFEAYDGDVSCLQASYSGIVGTIHCLQLDLHVPRSASSTNRLPVIVNIHGGGFVTGDKGALLPKFLIKHEVIIININYRLGVYGFLCSSENIFKNQGLKDQVLAMQWIKETIVSFGGDADRITVLGHSAGAMSIDLQLLVNENFANKAIIMSGASLTTWVLSPENDNIPINIAIELGFTGSNVRDAIQFLSEIDPAEVFTVADRIGIMRSENGHPLTKPCVESAGEEAFLTDYPVNLQPKVKGMDIMIGHTNKEIMFMYPKPEDTEYYRQYDFASELASEFTEIFDVDMVRQFYIGDEDVNENLQDAILDYGSDFVFVFPTQRTVDKYLDASANSVYNYMFSYEGGRNIMKLKNNYTSPGACHADDLAYLFEVPQLAGVTPSDEDQKMIEVMTKMWTDFAKEGRPTPDPELLSFIWPPVADKQRRPYLSIDRPIKSKSRLLHDRMAFWELYYELHGDKIKGIRT